MVMIWYHSANDMCDKVRGMMKNVKIVRNTAHTGDMPKNVRRPDVGCVQDTCPPYGTILLVR